MIQIYQKDNVNFNANGNITLKPTICQFKDSENELYIEHFFDEEERWKYIQFDNVVAVDYRGKKLLFRIYNVIKSLYKVAAYARPIFYDLIDTVIINPSAALMTGEEALNSILANTGFTGHSNISVANPFSPNRKNIVEAILSDEKNSFINTYGGEFYCENFDVYVNDRIGSDNGVRIEFGYNLNEIEESIDTSEVVTRIIPVGYDGITLDSSTPYVDSQNINKYPHPKMRVIEFADIKVKNETNTEGFNTIEEARQEMIKRCEALFNEGLDQPLINYKIDMINLSKTTYYKDFEELTTVSKGDTVTCYIPYLDINVQARVIDFEIDYLIGEYITIELGNVISNFIQNQADLQHRINSITNDNGTVKADLLSGTINALQSQFRALKDVAQPQDVLGMIFEDRVENSPTFGSVAIGSQGMMMANSYHPGTTDWNYRTFGTGSGLVADMITTGRLNANLLQTGAIRSADGSVNINLETGAFTLTNENGQVVIDGASQVHKIIAEGTTTINYTGQNVTATVPHSLNYKPAFSAYQMGADGVDQFTQLPALTWSGGTVSAIIRARCDSNNLYFDFNAAQGAIQGNMTITIKYFIYKEVAF